MVDQIGRDELGESIGIAAKDERGGDRGLHPDGRPDHFDRAMEEQEVVDQTLGGAVRRRREDLEAGDPGIAPGFRRRQKSRIGDRECGKLDDRPRVWGRPLR